MNKKSIALGVEIDVNLGKETNISTIIDINEFYHMSNEPNSFEDEPSAITIDGEYIDGYYAIVEDKKVERGELYAFGKGYAHGLDGEWLAMEGVKVSLGNLIKEVDRQVRLLGYEIV